MHSPTQYIDPTDLGALMEEFFTLAGDVAEQWQDESQDDANGTNPDLIIKAVEQLHDILQYHAGEEDQSSEMAELNQCSDYGLQLFSELSSLAASIHLSQQSVDIENLCFPFALWAARLGAEISTLEPVVNAISRIANSIMQPSDLEQLYREISEIFYAVSEPIRQDMDAGNPLRPWRVLLLNRAIVATRSHQPVLIEDAYKEIVTMLPEDASRFFREGMEQMDTIGYPSHVREIVETWFQRYSNKPTLH
ncbi:MAG: hypothetical protein IZT60_04855 [Gammaproteobacteria bacterium]|nr:hypothetical protein [Gammaproteobacteria bacterium]